MDTLVYIDVDVDADAPPYHLFFAVVWSRCRRQLPAVRCGCRITDDAWPESQKVLMV